MPKKKPKVGKPKVHKDLEGFEINFNEFGELKSNMSVDKLNKFLNKKVDDKKLRDRDDLDEDWENEEKEKLKEEQNSENLSPEEMEDLPTKDLKKLHKKDEEEE